MYKCVYLASMFVKIERTVGFFVCFFSKCISDGHASKHTGLNQSKTLFMLLSIET